MQRNWALLSPAPLGPGPPSLLLVTESITNTSLAPASLVFLGLTFSQFLKALCLSQAQQTSLPKENTAKSGGWACTHLTRL